MDADTALTTFTSLLDLEQFEVVDATLDRRNWLRRFTLVPDVTVGLCPHCQGLTNERHLCRDNSGKPIIAIRTANHGFYAPLPYKAAQSPSRNSAPKHCNSPEPTAIPDGRISKPAR